MLLLSVLVVIVTGATAFRQLDRNSLDDISHPLKFRPHQSVTKKQDFCNGLACPGYSVLFKNETGKFELRQYAESHWVTTDSTGMDYDAAGFVNFRKLFNYIDGENVKKEKVTMTCPVIVLINPGPGPACSSNFSMSFFVDPVAKTPPSPDNKAIHFSTISAVNVYVREFSGFADYNSYRNEGLALIAAIGDTSLFHADYYYTAGYDSPFKLTNRHNEVWLVAK